MSKKRKFKDIFLKNLKTQTKKRIKFSLDWLTIVKIKRELKVFNKLKSTGRNRVLSKQLKRLLSNKESELNDFIKREMFNYLNKIHQYSYELFKIKLDIISKKRSLIYRSRKLISSRDRGNRRNLKRTNTQYLWEFDGEFWADELGDYSFGLTSKCETAKKG